MAKKETRREKGTGNIYQRSNGTWVGRLREGVNQEGKPKIKYFSGKTESEVKKRIREYNKNTAPIDTNKVSVGTYLVNWLTLYKKDDLKPSSYDRLENTINCRIIPYIGSIQLQQLTSDDIVELLSDLRKEGLSYSSIKKVYDCLNAVLRHATIKDDISKNPMLVINPPSESTFPKKDIRYFSKEEALRIIEECGRLYTTGAPVYIYGDVYILMLNTGLRLGEAIGLLKADWDKENKTLHIKRNVQSVKKRNEDGESITGYVLTHNTTKTYSGDRIIPLNSNAQSALERLCERCLNAEYIVCSKKGDAVPPERIERTFYRILKNIGIEKTGTHSLRHTFASFLFKEGVDIKTISKILGHASIQITLNTYVHLIDNPDQQAVAKLDDLI